jgi:tRNA(His) 5'-end guanylyltransferase
MKNIEMNNNIHYKSFINEKIDKDEFHNQIILNKLSLRKKKLHEILYNKRGINANNNPILFTTGDSNKISYTKNDFLTGKIFDCLKVAFYSKNKQDLKNIFLIFFFGDNII